MTIKKLFCTSHISDCISQSSIVYDQFHIQAITEQMMDP